MLIEIETDQDPEETGWYVSLDNNMVFNEVVYSVPEGTYHSESTKERILMYLTTGEYKITVTDADCGLDGGNAIVYRGDTASPAEVMAYADSRNDFFDSKDDEYTLYFAAP